MRYERPLSLQVICFILSSPMAGVAQTHGSDTPMSIVDRLNEHSGLTFGFRYSDQMHPEASLSGTWQPGADFYITSSIMGDMGTGPMLEPHTLAVGLYHQPNLDTLVGLEVDANLGGGGGAGVTAILSSGGSLGAMVLSASAVGGYRDELGWSLDARARVDFPFGETAFGFAEGWLMRNGGPSYGLAVGATLPLSDQTEITLRFFQEGGDTAAIGLSSEVFSTFSDRMSTTVEASWVRDQADQIDYLDLVVAADLSLDKGATATISAEANFENGQFGSADFRIDASVERVDGELTLFATKRLGVHPSTAIGIGWSIQW